jgi:Glycosyltransferase family 10 (fucosyltransferase) C-term
LGEDLANNEWLSPAPEQGDPSMSICVHVHPKMTYTIFQTDHTRDVFTDFGVDFVDDPSRANVLIGSREGMLRDFIDRFGGSKRYLLWTHEPLLWTGKEKWATIAGQRVRTMSMHSGEVYFNNLYYASIRPDPIRSHLQQRRTLNRIPVMVAGAKLRGHPLLIERAGGIDLLAIRYELAIFGHSSGKLDVYGNGWPDGVSLGQSRSGRWSPAKYRILENYDFNLCFENSLVPYYCSEKIWQSIYCGCLPIYYGQQTIYEDFPSDSFLDYSTLGTPEALFEAVRQMSVEEFNARYESCLRVFEHSFPLGRLAREQAARFAALQIVALDVAGVVHVAEYA